MNKIFKYLIFIPLVCTGCDNLLDTYPYGQIDDDKMKEYQNYVSGLVGYAYGQLPQAYNDIQGNRLDCAADNGVMTSVSDNVTRLATGRIISSQDPFSSIWSSSYKAIANLNMFLENDLGLKTNYYLNPDLDIVYKRRLQGEAYALRALMQWRLLKFYGGRGMNTDKLLGFPIITERITTETENFNLERNTYDECVAQIVEDCDSAFKYLPIANRDFMVEDLATYQNILGSCNWGKMDQISLKAMLADLYLTYASPLFNPENDRERWKKAAEYAKEVMDFKLTGPDKVGFTDPYAALNWFDAGSPNCIFPSRSSESTTHETECYPTGFRGNATFGVTQELVDAFPMANGYPKGHEKANDYNESNPYSDRDFRLSSIVFYPGSTNAKGYTFETWVDETTGELAKDAPGLPKVSRTGYHLKKMVYQDWDANESVVKKGTHFKHYYRWEHMVLAFAEAANEYCQNPNEQLFGLSAIDAIKYLRWRNSYDGVASPLKNNDPYLEDIQNDKEAFRELIHNERRIELCFEGDRFFDIRRWNTDVASINKPVHKMTVMRKPSGELEYKVEELEARNYPSLYIPIPLSEVMRADKMEQNKGWETWAR